MKTILLFSICLVVLSTFNINSKALESDQLSSQEESNDSLFYREYPWLEKYYNMQPNVLIIDTVRFIEIDDIGDYSRICVEKQNTTRCFLDGTTTLNDSLELDNIVEIEWSVVKNHSIDDTVNTYYDKAIHKITKLDYQY